MSFNFGEELYEYIRKICQIISGVMFTSNIKRLPLPPIGWTSYENIYGVIGKAFDEMAAIAKGDMIYRKRAYCTQ